MAVRVQQESNLESRVEWDALEAGELEQLVLCRVTPFGGGLDPGPGSDPIPGPSRDYLRGRVPVTSRIFADPVSDMLVEPGDLLEYIVVPDIETLLLDPGTMDMRRWSGPFNQRSFRWNTQPEEPDDYALQGGPFLFRGFVYDDLGSSVDIETLIDRFDTVLEYGTSVGETQVAGFEMERRALEHFEWVYGTEVLVNSRLRCAQTFTAAEITEGAKAGQAEVLLQYEMEPFSAVSRQYTHEIRTASDDQPIPGTTQTWSWPSSGTSGRIYYRLDAAQWPAPGTEIYGIFIAPTEGFPGTGTEEFRTPPFEFDLALVNSPTGGRTPRQVSAWEDLPEAP